MNEQLSPEEIEKLFNFPCDFPIKAMGKAGDNFEAIVLEIVRKHCADLAEGAVKIRPSKGDKFLAVTITIRAHSKQQLDNIYQELSSHECVMMVL